MTERKASEPQKADESVQPPEDVNSAKPLDRLEAFRAHRGLLFSIAYRMLGSAADAEDILQETYIRWQQCGELDIRSPRAFLVTIASRLCINHLQSALVRRQEYFGSWLPEPVFTGPMNDSRLSPSIDESLSIAFLLLLERLTPAERAVFLLHEVFDYEYSEIANRGRSAAKHSSLQSCCSWRNSRPQNAPHMFCAKHSITPIGKSPRSCKRRKQTSANSSPALANTSQMAAARPSV